MKINLVYPKIPESKQCLLGKCWAFEKIDGTNLHWVWEPNLGWSHFGTRRTRFTLDEKGIQEFQETHSELSEAPVLFLRACQGIVNSPHQVILFTEFYGENSFAGNHQAKDKKKLYLFDAMVNGQLLTVPAFLEAFFAYQPPEEYRDDFGIPAIVYTGKYTGQLAQDVGDGKYSINEGVVVKGMVDGQVFMTKIKTKDYLKRLQQR